MKSCQRITITVQGDSEGALDDARDEAIRLIREGCTSGANHNESGGFYFEVTDDVPKGERPL